MSDGSANNQLSNRGASEPLVTVILTAFKRTAYLEGAICSVLAQTLKSLELIVADDANSRAARDICAQFAKDGRLRYRANPQTLGAPLNIAAALREARGIYVAILNDDDLMESQMLDRLVPPLEQFPNVVLAFGNHTVIDRGGHHLASESRNFMRARGRDGLKPGVLREPFEFAVRRGLMVVPEVSGAYDYWLAVRIAAQGLFYFDPANVMSWRYHEDSVSIRPSPDKFRAEVFVYNWLNELPLAPQLRQYVREQLAYFLYLRGYEFFRHGSDRREARAVLWRSLKLRPSARLFGAWGLTFMPTSFRCIAIRAWQRTQWLRGNEEVR